MQQQRWLPHDGLSDGADEAPRDISIAEVVNGLRDDKRRGPGADDGHWGPQLLDHALRRNGTMEQTNAKQQNVTQDDEQHPALRHCCAASGTTAAAAAAAAAVCQPRTSGATWQLPAQ
jgi:hypothetical protein